MHLKDTGIVCIIVCIVIGGKQSKLDIIGQLQVENQRYLFVYLYMCGCMYVIK